MMFLTLRHPQKLATPLVSALVLSSTFCKAQSTGQSVYLKEIIQGRCYEKFPTANQCPQVVGSIMSVLDSQLDANIDSISSFAPFLRQVDMTSPNNQALIWLTGNDGSFTGSSYQNKNVAGYGGYGGYSNQPQDSNFALHREMSPTELVTPELTPGGMLLDGLIFCGIDKKNDGTCTKQNSNAYSSFWAAAYSQFSRTASGRVQIVIEPYADLSFLRTNVVQQLNAYQVTEVTLYVDSCQTSDMKMLVSSFPISAVQCKDQYNDYAFFLLCQSPTSQACSMLSQVDTTGTISSQQTAAIEQNEEDEILEKKKNKQSGDGGGNFFVKFILFGIGCTLVYRYMQKPRGVPQYYQYDTVPPAETTSMRI